MPLGEVDKTPVGDEPGKDHAELYPESSRSLESLREMRLQALLRDMIDAEGGSRAAAVLGVSYRTLSRAVQSRRLTARMSAALERLLLLGGGSAAARERERMDALERRVEGLAREMHDGFDEARAAVDAGLRALGEEHAVAMRVLERRLDGLEARVKSGAAGMSETGTETTEHPRYVPPRMFPQLVTREAEEGEELVYGDATPLVVEWREAMAALLRAVKTGPALRRIAAHEPLWELEIALIGEHGLTLPPMRYPWDDLQRERQVSDRRDEIRHLHEERKRVLRRRWLRRLLTLGFSWE